jgi:alpha-glucosidase
LRTGTITFLKAEEPLLVLRRDTPEERLIAVFNLGPEPAEFLLPANTLPLQGHGLEDAPLHGRRLSLPPWGGFFGQASPKTKQ